MTEHAGKRFSAILISEVFGPAPLLTAVIVQSALHDEISWANLLLALLVALLVAILPYAALIAIAQRGRVSDRFVGNRRQRGPVLLAVLGSVAVAFAIVMSAGSRSPAALITMTVCSAVGLIVVAGVNLVWKLSIHSAIAAFFLGIQITYFGWFGLLALTVALAVGWARITLKVHSIAQVLAGYAAGAAVVGIYTLLS